MFLSEVYICSDKVETYMSRFPTRLISLFARFRGGDLFIDEEEYRPVSDHTPLSCQKNRSSPRIQI